MSNVAPLSTLRQEQDAWIARVLNRPMAETRSRLDALGVDVPRSDAQERVRPAAEALAPAAADPEAMRRTLALRDEHDLLSTSAAGLGPVAEVDDEGTKAQAALGELRTQINGLLAEPPSVERHGTVGGLIEQHRKDAGALERDVANRLAARVSEVRKAGSTAMGAIDRFGPVEPAFRAKADQLSGELDAVLATTPLTLGVGDAASRALKLLETETGAVATQLAQLSKQRFALQDRIKKAEAPKLNVDAGWVRAAPKTIDDARASANKALEAKLGPGVIATGEDAVSALEKYVASARTGLKLMTDAVKLNNGLGRSGDLPDGEKKQIVDASKVINTALLPLPLETSAAESAFEQFSLLIEDISSNIAGFPDLKSRWNQKWENTEKSYWSIYSAVPRPTPEMTAVGDRLDLVREAFFTANDKKRKDFSDAPLMTGLADLQQIITDIRAAVPATVVIAPVVAAAAPLKIGYDPFDAADQATLFGLYQSAGGPNPNQAQLMTVCQKAKKAGGHYDYQGTIYEMWHDSHGNGETSVTAWKIEVDGALQVVGVGFHAGANYTADFPHAGGSGTYSAQSELTDTRPAD